MKRTTLFSKLSILVLIGALGLFIAWPVQAQISPSGVIRGGAVRVELLSSAARTTDSQGSAVTRMQNFRQGLIFLDITAAATETADTLNVYIQTSPDGTDWCDVGSFAQQAGDLTTPVRRLLTWSSYSLPTADEGACTDATLAAGTMNQGPIADTLRVKWDITDSTTTGNLSFTFGVTGYFRE